MLTGCAPLSSRSASSRPRPCGSGARGRGTLSFIIEPSATPTADADRIARLVDPGFGRVFTDHMVTIDWTAERGWHDGRLTARTGFTVDPATAVLHYAQEIFEGLKAYRQGDGGVALFRPDANARRFRRSAERLAMPELPEDLFVDSVRALTLSEREWIPSVDGGALYLRPFMIATEAFLGVRPSARCRYMVIASATGAYFKGGAPSVTLWATRAYSRAAAGGTGEAKCGGNYAGSLAAQREAIANGCDQVVFLDAAERRWIEELGGMNIFFAFADGRVVTPPLNGNILPGITRDSLITLMRDDGIDVREEPYAFDDWRADAESGALTESFACGTAAVVTPIGAVRGPDGGFDIGGGRPGPGPLTARLRERLVSIQEGRGDDRHGWRMPLDDALPSPAQTV